MFLFWILESLFVKFQFLLSSLLFTRICTCICKINICYPCDTYIQSTLSRDSLLEGPSSYLLFLYLRYGQFCILPTLSSSFLAFSICDFLPLYALWSSRLFFLSLWTGRRDAEARRHSHSKYFTVSCSGTLGYLFSLFFSFLFFLVSLSFYPAHIFRKIDNEICTCEIHLLLTFIPLLFVLVKSSRSSCDRRDNSISLNRIRIGMNIAIDTNLVSF